MYVQVQIMCLRVSRVNFDMEKNAGVICAGE